MEIKEGKLKVIMAQEPVLSGDKQKQTSLQHTEPEGKLDETNAEPLKTTDDKTSSETAVYKRPVKVSIENHAPTNTKTHLSDRDDRNKSDTSQASVQLKDLIEEPLNEPDTYILDGQKTTSRDF